MPDFASLDTELGKPGVTLEQLHWKYLQTEPYDIVREFRTRQHHEQTYRVMLRDIHVDTAPSGYNKRSRDPKRPGFQQGALSLFGWIAALVTNFNRSSHGSLSVWC